MARTLNQSDLTKIKHIPSMIYLDPKDELIGLKNLTSFIDSKDLTQWKIQLIENRKNLKQKEVYHHQIFNEYSLGTIYWNKLIREITFFLKS